MDGLAEFEKELARERAEREEEERKERRHRHHHSRREHHHKRHASPEQEDSKQGSQGRGGDGGRDRDRDRDRGRDGDRDRAKPRDRSPGHRRRRSRERSGAHRRARSRDDQGSDDGGDHRSKRSRHARHSSAGRRDASRHRHRQGGEGGAGGDGSEYLAAHDPKEDLPLPDEERPMSDQPLVRDAWMTAPSGVEIDYMHRKARERTPPVKEAPQHLISTRELNSEALQQLNRGQTIDELERPAQPAASYTFGDGGSQWRMTKLKGVYTVAEQSGRSVDEVALERYGSLREFDEAREEREELERRRVYGKGYAVKNKPAGDLHAARLKQAGGGQDQAGRDQAGRDQAGRDQAGRDQAGRDQGSRSKGDSGDASDDGDGQAGSSANGPRPAGAPPPDQTTLNYLRAQLMKAKLRKSPDVARLEEEFNQALAAFSSAADEHAVVLDASHSRMLAGTRGEVKAINTKRGRERNLVEANDDMTVEDMVREERRTRGVAGGDGRRLAERIAKDSKFDDDLEYLDENAEKLAKRVHKSEANLKNVAVHEYNKMNRILDSCPLCFHEDRKPPLDQPLAPVVSLATRVFLTLPTEPELTGAEGGAVIVPVEHHTNLLECSDDEWEEMRNFMKALTRLYHDQGRDVLFYENAAAPQRRMHAALVAVPIPYELGDTAPAFFRDAMLSADEEWSQHKKIIDTGRQAREGLGKAAFRKSIAKEMPYFHVWFSLDGGLGHVVEDAGRWPRGDLFAREIIGGMLDVDAGIIKRQGRWTRDDPRLDDFKKRWRKFDWTRVLTEG